MNKPFDKFAIYSFSLTLSPYIFILLSMLQINANFRFVLYIICFIFFMIAAPILGILLGFKALERLKINTEKKGKDLALTGIILASIYCIFLIIILNLLNFAYSNSQIITILIIIICILSILCFIFIGRNKYNRIKNGQIKTKLSKIISVLFYLIILISCIIFILSAIIPYSKYSNQVLISHLSRCSIADNITCIRPLLTNPDKIEIIMINDMNNSIEIFNGQFINNEEIISTSCTFAALESDYFNYNITTLNTNTMILVEPEQTFLMMCHISSEHSTNEKSKKTKIFFNYKSGSDNAPKNITGTLHPIII